MLSGDVFTDLSFVSLTCTFHLLRFLLFQFDLEVFSAQTNSHAEVTGETLTCCFLLEPLDAVAQVNHKTLRAQTKLDTTMCPEGMSVRRTVVHGARLFATGQHSSSGANISVCHKNS